MGGDTFSAIRDAILDHGPITFAEFVELALYGPGGFYEEPPVGEAAHFVTSPHAHPVFASLLAQGLRQMWEALGEPEPFTVVEVGAGDGTLARGLLHALTDLPLDYVAVDRSPGARRRLEELPVRVAATLEAVGGKMAGALIANELLDNLPFHRLRRTAEGLRQVCVSLEGDRMIPVDLPCDEGFLFECPEVELVVGEEVSVSLDAFNLVFRFARAFERGYALLVDYAHSSRSEVHGYRHQSVVEDVLSAPGEIDVTTPVDFAPLRRRAGSLGLQTLLEFPQSLALRTLGFDDWIEEQRSEQGRALDRRSGREAVGRWSARNRAYSLIDPGGLGSLRWLPLATPGVSWPPWLRTASLSEDESRWEDEMDGEAES